MDEYINIQKMCINKSRYSSIDMSRGVIMILMAIDHAVFFIMHGHLMEYWGRPFPEYSSKLQMITRLTSHFCAPGFFLLMGIGLILFYESRKSHSWSDKKIIRTVMLRGVMLIILQLSIVNLAWYIGSKGMKTVLGVNGPAGIGGQIWFNLDVLYGLGISMVFLAILIKANKNLLLLLSILSFISSKLFFPPLTDVDVAFSPILRMIFIPGQTGSLLVDYPLLPWVSIALFGMWIGKKLVINEKVAYKYIAIIGFCFIIIFVALRVWEIVIGNESYSFDSFFALIKYPPSISYVLLTVGGNLLILWLFSLKRHRPSRNNVLIIFGRNALFFYVVHLYIYALVGRLFPYEIPFFNIYFFTVLGLIPLYYMCKVYMEFKKKKSIDSIWRLI